MAREDYDAISQWLSANGLGGNYIGSFDGMAPISGVRGRLICGERGESGELMGTSFWVQIAPDASYLGVWSGILYRLDEPEKLLPLIQRAFATLPRGVTPRAIPSAVVDEFNLIETEA